MADFKPEVLKKIIDKIIDKINDYGFKATTDEKGVGVKTADFGLRVKHKVDRLEVRLKIFNPTPLANTFELRRRETELTEALHLAQDIMKIIAE